MDVFDCFCQILRREVVNGEVPVLFVCCHLVGLIVFRVRCPVIGLIGVFCRVDCAARTKDPRVKVSFLLEIWWDRK